MTRTNESGGFHGAISSMLAVADVCPSCGKLVAEHRRYPYSENGVCPDVVHGTFPYIAEDAIASLSPDDPASSNPTAPATVYPSPSDDGPTGIFASSGSVGRPRRTTLLSMTWNLAHGKEDFP